MLTGATSSSEIIVSTTMVALAPATTVLFGRARSPCTGPRPTNTRSVRRWRVRGRSPGSGGAATSCRVAPRNESTRHAVTSAVPREGATVPGVFVGREAELGRLLSHWERVRAGEGPRAAALLAEPGLGKTRLAQELYARLVADEQGGTGYWPPALGAEGDNLRVNPAVEACDGAADLPFLWWGVRLADPEGHNQAVS